MAIFGLVQVAIAAKGGSAPPQTAFTSLQYTDRNGTVHTIMSAAATYTVEADNSATWSWDVGGIAELPNQADGATTPLVMS